MNWGGESCFPDVKCFQKARMSVFIIEADLRYVDGILFGISTVKFRIC